jgi:hypothetical protein
MKKTLFTALVTLLQFGSVNAQDCPNGDFENWTSHPYKVSDSGWYNSNLQSLVKEDSLTVWPVTGFIGQAVHIQTAIVGTDTLQAYVINTLGDPKVGTGGMPYSQQPTAIAGYYRYNLKGNDSALMIIEFKKAGIVISATSFTFRNVSGSIASFTAFSFPLASIPTAPDSVIIGIASSNLDGIGVQSGSWLEIDQLKFTGSGITESIAGGTFDNWSPQSLDKPNNWQVQAHGNSGNGVNKSTSHVSGSYSIQLITQPSSSGSVECANITSGNMSANNGPSGGIPYTLMSDTLTGYYKYAPTGTDTGRISVNLSAAGIYVGGNNYHFFSAPTWTYFEMPFSAMTTPDTIRIDIQSGSWNAITSGSVLNIDYLQLKSQPLPPLSVNNIQKLSDHVIVYPNPVNDLLNFKFEKSVQGSVSVKIYDIMGQVIDYKNYEVAPAVISFLVGHLSYGMYFYEIRNNDTVIRDKFIKE